MTDVERERHDVIVVGAGPAGSAAAHFLARAGLDVLLLDKAEFPRDKTCGDGLTPRALPVLQDMGLLDAVLRIGHRLDVLEIAAPSGRATQVRIPPMQHAPSYVVIVPRFKLDNLILERAISSGARFQGSAHVTKVETEPDGVTVTAQVGGAAATYRARAAILATGAGSRLLSEMGLFAQPPQTHIAARAYFDDIAGLNNRFHFALTGAPQTGYGWVFPLSATSANVGVGYALDGRGKSRSARTAFEAFVNSPTIRALLAGARQIGPLRSFPLRTDFASAPTTVGRVLMAGEAAGLVNPLTGDGIDYALESGKIAAEHLRRMFADDDFSSAWFTAYDAALREKYQNLFRYCGQIQQVCRHETALNLLVPMATRFPRLADLLSLTVLGGKSIPGRVTPLTVLRAMRIRV